MIHDLAELAAPAVAAARGIPQATVAFSGALSDRLLQGVVQEMADVWQHEGLHIRDDAGLYEGMYLHRFPPSLGPEPAIPTLQRVRPVGFDGAATQEVPEWVSGLGVGRPAVYVSLGTVVVAGPAWRELFDAFASMDVDAVATIGLQLADADVGTVPPNVRMERYVPQSFVLDKVSAVVSHAGAGTMLAAAGRGLPQVSLPMGADMWENADALARAGAGITLEEDHRDADDVRAAVERVLTDPPLTTAANRLADEINEMPHPDEVVMALEALIAKT